MSGNELNFEPVLAELARGNVVAEGNFEDVLRFLIERAAQTLLVQRVSVWLFDETHRKLFCSAVYDAADDNCPQGEELLAVDYPRYFSALEKMRTIAAIDATTDLRTTELRENYLRRHNITTMLDAPIFLQGKVVGVVCHEHSDSQRVWAAAEKSFAGSIADFISLALEASRRIAAERRLREVEDLLKTVTAQMSDGFCLLEPATETNEFTVRYVNLSGAAMYGYAPDELVGQSATIIRAPGQNINLFELMQRREESAPVVFEMLTQRKDGTTFPVEINLDVVEYNRKKLVALIGRDISARQTAEQLRIEAQAKTLQAQRLESLGMLAGKIAHDFNNLLVGILGNANLATRHLPSDHKVSGYLANIESTVQIAADLCNQLLIYAGRQQFNLNSVNLSEVVEEMSRLLKVSLPPDVTLESTANDNLPAIAAEPTQVRQILLNLVTNAADAVKDQGGTVKIKTVTEVLNETELQGKFFDVQAADFVANVENKVSVRLEVKDDGAGMNAETRMRMFEPFFSNKAAAGRGLGLASLAGIVRAHGGAISVESELSQGTTVSVWFPAQKEGDLGDAV